VGTAADPNISYDDLLGSYDGRGEIPFDIKRRLYLQKQFADSSFYLCPMDEEPDPAFAGFPVQRRTYGLTAGSSNPGNTFRVGISDDEWSAKITDVNSPSDTVVMAEMARTANNAGRFQEGSIISPFDLSTNPQWIAHHDGSPNFAYADGHVGVSTFEETLLGQAPGGPYTNTQWDYER
jgi:prepilin-type processing-associated H-X9-DG protein